MISNVPCFMLKYDRGSTSVISKKFYDTNMTLFNIISNDISMYESSNESDEPSSNMVENTTLMIRGHSNC